MEEDRRLFARIDVKLSLKFLNQATGKVGQGQTLNISANGVCFATEESIGPYIPVGIWLNIPDHHEPLYVHGKVVWVGDLEDDDKKKCIGVCVEIDKDELMGLGRILMV